MKSNYFQLSITFFTLFTSVYLSAQKEFQGKAYYQSKTTLDMNSFGGGQMSEERKKQIAERMKNSLEKTYILTFTQSESFYKEEERLEAPSQGRGGFRFGMMNSVGNQYKNLKNKLILKKQELFGKQFLIKDSLPKFDWELSGETKKIGQYTCSKATAMKKIEGFDINSFRRPPTNNTPKDSLNTGGEEKPKEILVTVWYTPQIPINQGPGNYWGLPGLILEVNAGRTTILCSKVVLNPTEKETIKIPSKGKEVTQKEYDDILKKKIEEMREMRGRNGRGGGRPR